MLSRKLWGPLRPFQEVCEALLFQQYYLREARFSLYSSAILQQIKCRSWCESQLAVFHKPDLKEIYKNVKQWYPSRNIFVLESMVVFYLKCYILTCSEFIVILMG